MHCIVLYCIALHCIVLHCIILHCIVLHVLHCIVPHHTQEFVLLSANHILLINQYFPPDIIAFVLIVTHVNTIQVDEQMHLFLVSEDRCKLIFFLPTFSHFLIIVLFFSIPQDFLFSNPTNISFFSFRTVIPSYSITSPCIQSSIGFLSIIKSFALLSIMNSFPLLSIINSFPLLPF